MPHPRSLPLALLVVCALLGAQWFGSWHRIAHAPGVGAPLAAAQLRDAVETGLAFGYRHEHAHEHEHEHHGHERGSADCRLLDHLLGALPIAAAPGPTLPLAEPDSPPGAAPGLAPHAAAWRQPAARGPPVAA